MMAVLYQSENSKQAGVMVVLSSLVVVKTDIMKSCFIMPRSQI